MSIQDFINAFEEGKAFELISNHGYEFSKTELIDIVKELIYGIETTLDEPDLKAVKNITIDSLELY